MIIVDDVAAMSQEEFDSIPTLAEHMKAHGLKREPGKQWRVFWGGRWQLATVQDDSFPAWADILIE